MAYDKFGFTFYPMKRKGIYKYHCTTHDVNYVGETARSFEIRDKEHRKAAEQQKWSHSGLTQHMQNCDTPIDKPEILCFTENKNKLKLKYDLRVKEALFIQRHKSGPGKGMNEDYGSYVKTQAWTPVFNRM